MNKKIEQSNGVQIVEAETLKKYLRAANLVGHLTEIEIDQFISISTAFGLNPFKREIYASKYGNNFSIVVGYETYIKRAERSGRLSGWKVTTEGTFDKKNPGSATLKAIVTIHRSDFLHPFEHEVYFSEYCQRTRDGRLTKFWSEKPITMIKKVAISQGFRLCFSDELGGLPYTKEEIGQEERFDSFQEVKEPVKTDNKKMNQAIESLKESFVTPEEQVKTAKDRDELASIWKANKLKQSEGDFLKLVKAKADELKNDQEGQKEAISGDQTENTDEQPEMKSSDVTIKDLKEFVSNFKDPEALQEFAEGETRKGAIEIIDSRLNEITVDSVPQTVIFKNNEGE